MCGWQTKSNQLEKKWVFFNHKWFHINCKCLNGDNFSFTQGKRANNSEMVEWICFRRCQTSARTMTTTESVEPTPTGPPAPPPLPKTSRISWYPGTHALSLPKYQSSWYSNAILLVGEKVFFQVIRIVNQNKSNYILMVSNANAIWSTFKNVAMWFLKQQIASSNLLYN